MFDVSHKKDMYGRGTGYNVFAGKDASKGLGECGYPRSGGADGQGCRRWTRRTRCRITQGSMTGRGRRWISGRASSKRYEQAAARCLSLEGDLQGSLSGTELTGRGTTLWARWFRSPVRARAQG